MNHGESGRGGADALDYLRRLVDHELTSVGVSAGRIEGLSLGPLRSVMEALGEPQRAYRVVHVTGTNGKGSVCRMIERLVSELGLRVGTYMSPEGTVNERIRVDLAPIGDADLGDAVASVRGVAEHLDVELTAFEAVTASALVAFADAPVDVAVIEVGLLGRYDATNVVDADVAVLTNVGADHTDFIGDWRSRIASEKAGIVKPGSIAVLGTDASDVIAHVEAEGPLAVVAFGHNFELVDSRVAVGGRHVVIDTSSGGHHEVFVPIHGRAQEVNAAVAIEAVESLIGGALPAEIVEAAFAGLSLPGRIEVASTEPVTVLDGAHNPDAAASLGAALAESFMIAGRRTAVVGMLAGRDPVAFLRALHERFPIDLVVATPVEGVRGQSADAIVAAAERVGIAAISAPDLKAAVARARQDAEVDDLVLVTGSFRLVDPARAAVRRREH